MIFNPRFLLMLKQTFKACQKVVFLTITISKRVQETWNLILTYFNQCPLWKRHFWLIVTRIFTEKQRNNQNRIRKLTVNKKKRNVETKILNQVKLFYETLFQHPFQKDSAGDIIHFLNTLQRDFYRSNNSLWLRINWKTFIWFHEKFKSLRISRKRWFN